MNIVLAIILFIFGLFSKVTVEGRRTIIGEVLVKGFFFGLAYLALRIC